jgi:hypothetical protein
MAGVPAASAATEFGSTCTANQGPGPTLSAMSGVTSGLNTFETRIPVHAGDRLGASGGSEIGALFCRTENPADRLGAIAGLPALGSTATVIEETEEEQITASATVEPDADGDGYGDETQDKCPQSAAIQTPCPVVTLSTSSSASKGFVKALVTSNVQATVTVAGTTKLGKGKAATLSGGTQIVAPG